MKKNRILTESQKKQIIDDKQKNIIENFANVFNKIKRLNENELTNELPEEVVEFITNEINNLKYKDIFNEEFYDIVDPWEKYKNCFNAEYEFTIPLPITKYDPVKYYINIFTKFEVTPDYDYEDDASDVYFDVKTWDWADEIKITITKYDSLDDKKTFTTNNPHIIKFVNDITPKMITKFVEDKHVEWPCEKEY